MSSRDYQLSKVKKKASGKLFKFTTKFTTFESKNTRKYKKI